MLSRVLFMRFILVKEVCTIPLGIEPEARLLGKPLGASVSWPGARCSRYLAATQSPSGKGAVLLCSLRVCDVIEIASCAQVGTLCLGLPISVSKWTLK